MKIKNPFDRTDVTIKKSDSVIEVGPGPYPTRRADVLVEKFPTSNYHRSDDALFYSHQQVIIADGACMPFKDKEFDYIICCQVVEHAEDAAAFIDEHVRVAKRGYLEAPSLIGELLFPKESHKWAMLEIDDKLVLFEKSKFTSEYKPDFGNTFLNHLPYNSLAMRLLMYTHGDIFTIRYEWKDGIDYLINPEDPYYKSFFTKTWTDEMMYKIFPKRSKWQEIKLIARAICFIVKGAVKHRFARTNTRKIKDL